MASLEGSGRKQEVARGKRARGRHASVLLARPSCSRTSMRPWRRQVAQGRRREGWKARGGSGTALLQRIRTDLAAGAPFPATARSAGLDDEGLSLGRLSPSLKRLRCYGCGAC